MKTITLEFSHAEVAEPDYTIRQYPFGALVKMMMKANEIGRQGREIEVVEVGENFANGRKYIDFILKEHPPT